MEDSDMNDNFYEELSKQAMMSGVTCGAANHLDDLIKTLKSNFTERTDYLRLLVKTFDGMFDNQDNKHLKLFHILMPALTINYVEAALAAKEKVNKKNAPDSYVFVRKGGFLRVWEIY